MDFKDQVVLYLLGYYFFYFQIKDSADPKTEKFATWINPGPDFTLDLRNLTSLQKSLAQLQVCTHIPETDFF